MKKLLVYILAVACVLGLAACGHAPEQEEAVDLWDTVADKTFVYEKEGCGGEFYIYLWENGNFQYYAGMLSSYIGMGKWTLEGDILTLTDNGCKFMNRFRVEDGGLTYLEEGSTNFMYVKVADGDRFEGREGKPDILYHEA